MSLKEGPPKPPAPEKPSTLPTISNSQPSSSNNSKEHFKLTLCLKEAHDLIAMDKCGTSDPYVKVKVDGHTTYKTKTIMKKLDPVWNETCEVHLDHLSQKVALSVYDYDLGSISDDFLGRADIDLLKLEHDKVVQHKLELQNKDAAINSGRTVNTYRGYIIITTYLENLTQQDTHKKKCLSSPKSSIKEIISKPEFVKRLTCNNQNWRHVLEVVIGRVRNVRIPMFAVSSNSQTASSHFLLRIGYENEWQRSKAIVFPANTDENHPDGLAAKVGEQFTFYIRDERLNELNVELCQSSDSSNAIGKTIVDLRQLSLEQTHKFDNRFSDNSGYVTMTVSLTGTRPDVIAALGCLPAPTWTPGGPYLILPQFLRAEETTWMKELEDTFAIQKTNQLPGTAAGVLVLKVIQARNLTPADVDGKSDPFAVIEIVNIRLRTHTDHKTLHPKWHRIFIIPIEDIHSIMTITVFDEDRDGKPDFLGKMMVPLLRLQAANGERHWFPLKTTHLTDSATSLGGVELEGHLFYNKARAVARAFEAKEQSYLEKEEKVSIKLLQRDIAKVNKLVGKFFHIIDHIRDLMSWTDPKATITALFFWVLICYSFEPWMAPFALAVAFAFTYFFGSKEPHSPEDDYNRDHQAINETGSEENKFSLTDKLNKLQEICLTIHRIIGNLTALYERLKNIVLWRSPWVSAAAVTAFLLIALLLYIIPVRWLMLIFGVHELLKKKIRPSAGFEVYDLISRAYTDGEMIKFREPKTK